MKQDKTGYLYLLTTLLLFSTYEVVSKTLIGIIDPYQVNFIRFLVGGAFLFAVLAARRDAMISRRDLGVASAAGVLNVVVSMSLTQLALYGPGAKASVVAVIFSSNPIFVMIFSALIDKERIGAHKIAGLVLGVVGILVIFMEKIDLNFASYESALLALASAVSFGLYTVVGGRCTRKIGSLKMNAYSFTVGSLALLPVLIVSGIDPLHFDAAALPRIAYLSVFVTGVAYFTYFMGLSLTGTVSGSLVFFGKPVFANLFAVILLGEKFTANLAAGTLLILAGIAGVLYWEAIIARFRKGAARKPV